MVQGMGMGQRMLHHRDVNTESGKSWALKPAKRETWEPSTVSKRCSAIRNTLLQVSSSSGCWVACTLLRENQCVLRVCPQVHAASLPAATGPGSPEEVQASGWGQSPAATSLSYSGRGGPWWQCPPDMGTYPRKLCQPAQRAGSSLPGCRETGRECEARASMPFPVP